MSYPATDGIFPVGRVRTPSLLVSLLAIGILSIAGAVFCESLVPLLAGSWAGATMGRRSLHWLSKDVAIFVGIVGVMSVQALRVVEYQPNTSVFDPLWALVFMGNILVCVGVTGMSALRAWSRGRAFSGVVRAISLPVGFVVHGLIHAPLYDAWGVDYK